MKTTLKICFPGQPAAVVQCRPVEREACIQVNLPPLFELLICFAFNDGMSELPSCSGRA